MIAPPAAAVAAPATPTAPAPVAANAAAPPDNAEAAPAPAAAPPAAAANTDLVELWQQILAGLELPSTRMLLSQQAVLARLDQQRAVVQVAGNWMAMVQSRLPLLEKAVASALGSPRQVMLEAGGAPPPQTPPSAPERPTPVQVHVPTPAPSPPTPPVATAPQAEPVATAPEPAPSAPQPLPVPAPVAAAPEVIAEAPKPQAGLIDDQAKRLADFFNGEVVQLDGPLPELEDGSGGSQAA